MVVKSNKMPIQENHSVVKQFTIAAKVKAKSVQHLTHAKGQPDRVISNAKIAVNDQRSGALFRAHRQPDQSPANPHGSSFYG